MSMGVVQRGWGGLFAGGGVGCDGRAQGLTQNQRVSPQRAALSAGSKTPGQVSSQELCFVYLKNKVVGLTVPENPFCYESQEKYTLRLCFLVGYKIVFNRNFFFFFECS